MLDISKKLNDYDIGLYLLGSQIFNCRMALPNKLFEFIQARLAVAIWPSPEMKKIVEKENIGIVANDFTIESMAKMLNVMTIEQLRFLKNQSEHAAKHYNAEANALKIKKIIRSLVVEH